MGLKGYRLWVMGHLDSTCSAPPRPLQRLAVRAVAVQVAFERQTLKPVFHFIGAWVETTWVPGAFQLWVRGSQRAPPHRGALNEVHLVNHRRRAVGVAQSRSRVYQRQVCAHRLLKLGRHREHAAHALHQSYSPWLRPPSSFVVARSSSSRHAASVPSCSCSCSCLRRRSHLVGRFLGYTTAARSSVRR
jgi:hypothetical protein